jgi:hypothetical protein
MIVDRPSSHFVFVVPAAHVHERYNYINFRGKPLTNKQYLDEWGKWLIFGQREELDEIAAKLDPFVEARQVPAAKLDRKRIDEFGLDACVMCVYCHFQDRNAVWDILAGLGVKDKAWMFERETLEKWLPGGVNLEKWIAGQNMAPAQADKVRDEAAARFRRWFSNDDAIFTGIEQ